MVNYDAKARTQFASDILPPPDYRVATFPLPLVDAIRFLMAAPKHEGERLEIAIAPVNDAKPVILSYNDAKLLFSSPDFPGNRP